MSFFSEGGVEIGSYVVMTNGKGTVKLERYSLGETIGKYCGSDRGSSDGRKYWIGDGKINVSIIGVSIGKGGGMAIGSSDGFSGGSGDGKLEGY